MKKLLSVVLSFLLILSSFSVASFAIDGAVAKVGNTEYTTIDEAIAAWTNGTTLTLLDNVTLSNVVKLKSTENHTLNLGTYTLTAASGQHAIEITCDGRSSASYALTVNADATNPGGITATGKSCIYYKKTNTTQDRPIIVINNGVFNGSYSLNCTSNGNTNCPQFWINGGVFNAYVNLTKTLLKVTGGTFNAAINCTGDQNAYRLFIGGTFKSWQFMTSGQASNGEEKLTIGNSKNNFDNGVYVDDNGYLVVGGPIITEPDDKFEASSTYLTGWSSYLQYSSAKDNGLYYTSVEEALADNNKSSGNVTVYVDELDMSAYTTYAGTIIAPEGKTLTIKNAPEGLKTEGDVIIVKPVAKIGEVTYNTLQEAIDSANKGDTVVLLSDIALAEGIVIAPDDQVVLDLNGKTISRNTDTTISSSAITNNGTLTIKDTLTGGKITAFAANPDTADIPYYANNTITNCGVLTIEGGTIENSTGDEARAAFPIDNNSTSRDAILNIVGGTITGRGAIRQFANSTKNKNEVNITDGVVSGTSYGIWMQNPGSGDPVASLNVSGGEVAKILLSPSANFEPSITGGKISEVAIWAATGNADRDPAGFITGGTFDNDVSAFCAESYVVIENTDGTYGVKYDPAYGKVAKIGDIYYDTLEEAMAAAQAGDTVTIFEGTYAVPAMKAGITVVGEGNVLLEGTLSGTLENLTLKNLHIKGSNAQRWAYAKGDLVFENVTFEATSVYALHFDGIADGTNLLYKDCTIIGWAAMGGSPASCVFDGCTIKGNGSYGVIRTYFDATIKDCTFDVADVNPDDVYQDGIHSVDATVTVENTTNVNGDMKDILDTSGNGYVDLDGELIHYHDWTQGETVAPDFGVEGYTLFTCPCGTEEKRDVQPAKVAAAQVGETIYETLADAFAAANDGDTIKVLGDIELNETIKNTKKVTLDLNGKTITGTDNNTSGNFYLINNVGELTITGNGKITLEAVNNRNWNASSVVVANNPGGKLVVENGTIEHLGGTNMAYGIDNLTNGKGTYAETVINGGTIKSTYSGIRQFLNGVEAQNILTVNGGTVMSDNRAIFFQDPSKNANSGTLTITDNAKIYGKVHLSVTEGSTEWPVEVSVAAAALQGESAVTNNYLPAGYVIENNGGVYGVAQKKAIATVNGVEYYDLQEAINAAANGGTVELIANVELTNNITVAKDANVTINLNGFDITYTAVSESGNNMITNNGKLTFNGDGNVTYTENGTAPDNNSLYACNLIRNTGTLIINGGTFTVETPVAGKFNVTALVVDNYASSADSYVEINGGTFVSEYFRTIRLFATSTTYKNQVVINGGDFEGQVWLQSTNANQNIAILEINGGTFAPTANDASAVYITTVSSTAIDVAITDGTFNGKIGIDNTTNLSGFVTGGTFTATAKAGTNEAVLAESFEFVENSNGTFGVEEVKEEKLNTRLYYVKGFKPAGSNETRYGFLMTIGIDSLNYKNDGCGFYLTIDGVTRRFIIEGGIVWEDLTVVYPDRTDYITPDQFGAGNKYIMNYTVYFTDVQLAALGDKEVTVQGFVTTFDGVEIKTNVFNCGKLAG